MTDYFDNSKQKTTRDRWLEIITKAKAIYEENKGKKHFREICKDLKVSYSLFSQKWRNLSPENIHDYKHVFLKALEKKKASSKKLKKITEVKETKIHKDLVFILMELESGSTISEVSRKLGATRQSICNILKSHGFEYIKDSSKYDLKRRYKEVYESSYNVRLKAFMNGLSLYDYFQMKRKLSPEIFNLLRDKMIAINRNATHVKLLEYSNSYFMQMSLLELLKIYLEVVNKNYPDISKREALLKVLKDGKNFMLVRKDFSIPYTRENVRVMNREEFGSVFGNNFGINSEYQLDKNIKPRGIRGKNWSQK